MNSKYYHKKSKLKQFHVSMLIYFILFIFTYIFIYFKFILLSKLFFCATFISFLYFMYSSNIFYNHMKNKMRQKKENGVHPIFDTDIIDD